MNSESTPAPRLGGEFVFWILTGLGAIVFAPCLLLPEWRLYEALHYAEQWERHRLEALELAVGEQRRTLDALQQDPGALARVARRELGYLRPDERVVEVGPLAAGSFDVPAQALDIPFEPRPVPSPRFVEAMSDLLPDFDYDSLFCEPRTRTVLMTMSLALVLSACVLFRRGGVDQDAGGDQEHRRPKRSFSAV